MAPWSRKYSETARATKQARKRSGAGRSEVAAITTDQFNDGDIKALSLDVAKAFNDELRSLQARGDVDMIQVAEPLYDYLVRVVAATRELPDVRLGASPRGSVALLRAVRVRAASQGRSYALPEDVKALAGPVLAHRLILTPEAELSGRTGADVIAEVLATVPVPQGGGVRV